MLILFNYFLSCQVRAHGLTNKPLNFALTSAELAAGRDQAMKSSIYTGVAWNKDSCRWRVRGRANGKLIHIGYYDTDIAAARAYDEWARQHEKQLNFPENTVKSVELASATMSGCAQLDTLPNKRARGCAVNEAPCRRAAVVPRRPTSKRHQNK